MMQDEVVTRRRWLTEAEFLDLLGATNLIPGPNSTEMAIHIGLRQGVERPAPRGSLLHPPSGAHRLCLRLGLRALWIAARCRRSALRGQTGHYRCHRPGHLGTGEACHEDALLMGLGVAALVLAALGMDEVLLLFGAGVLAGILCWAMPPAGMRRPAAFGVLNLLLIAAAMVLVPTALTHFWSASAPGGATGHGVPFGLAPLLLFFLKVGSVLYGSGYVLLAFLRDGLVTQWHWLTEAQLLDATAVGQVTPGPVFTTATFIGYVLGGPWAALVATLGIFLPSFVFVAVSGPLVPRLRRSLLAGAFLDGVNVAALALMLAVTWQLGRAALVDVVTVGLAVVSAVLLVRYRVNSVWLILVAAVLGILVSVGVVWTIRCAAAQHQEKSEA